jgi:hypothetical protein
LGRGKEKERGKGWACWAESKERKKKSFSIFLKKTNTFKLNLNSGI